MRKFLKRFIICVLIVIGALLTLALGKYIISGCGTVGLEYRSNGDGTCYVSGIGRAKAENIRIPTLSPQGERVTGIGKSAFEDCDNIKTVKLHDRIETIGADAFYDCDSLIYTKYDNAYYVGNQNNPYLILVKTLSTSVESCNIHPDTEIIYSAAFSGCEELRSIEIPTNVRSIGSYAFAWCSNLAEINIAQSVRTIDEYAFLDCYSLETIKIPAGIKKIGNWAFAFCDGIDSIEFADKSRLASIGDYAFYGCDELESIDLYSFKSLKKIGYAAFAGCSALSRVTAPRGKVSIGEVAFLGCDIENSDEILAHAERPKPSKYVKDVPETVGVLNTILKAKQLKNLNFYTEDAIPHQKGDIAAHKMHVGLVYSSSRIENLFVPNFVSLYSFITSTKNPRSYLYSVNIGEIGNVNGDTYYGAVCSTYCSYALGIGGLYTTYQWTDIPDMSILQEHSVDSLALGDTVLGKGHVLIVTGIERDRMRNVNKITLMDIAQAGVREETLTRDEFFGRYDGEEYTYCRYGKISESNFDTTKFAIVYDRMPKGFNFNVDIIPRKGDKSNWLAGHDVEIDVLNTDDYQKVEIYQDGKLIQVRGISKYIVLVGLRAGSYKARLVGENGASEFCYWIVVDAESVATPSEQAKCVNVSFSATNAKPLFIVWQEADANGTKHVQFLTADEAKSGFAIGKYTSGDYKVRVAFETEYGIIFSTLPDEITVK